MITALRSRFQFTLSPHLHGFLFALVISLSSELVLSTFVKRTTGYSQAGRVVVLFLSLYTIHRYALSSLRTYKQNQKHLWTLASVIVWSVILVWVGRIVSESLASYATSSKYLAGFSPHSIHFATPFASGALLIQAVLGLQYGLIFSVMFSLIVGLYSSGNDSLLFAYILVTSLVACLSLLRFRSRAAYVKAGAHVAVIGLAMVLASLFIDTTVTTADVVVRTGGAVVGAILCVFVAAGVTPVLEYLGGYVTDMRLIEMATLDHPLLKELSIQAPGTWNHSMVMGMMVEAGADAIGANPVLARVSSYFHDIGKLKKPLYFVENQQSGENRHDKLSPSMSALIIRAHVKEGIELARKHKLPQVIEDMIPQHHGTSVIEYFYDKAVKEAGEGDPAVDRSLYAYPGPRPQSREAGILMLADGIEAASRTLPDQSPERIQGMVQKMINKVFASGELDESDLTLKDLHLIAKAFTRVLTGIYHQRIAYAEPAEKTNEKTFSEESGGGSSVKDMGGGGKKQKSPGEDTSGEGPNKEDLKRLGL